MRTTSAATARLPRRRLRTAVLTLAALLLLAALVGLVAHFRAPGRYQVLGVSAFAPYLMLSAPVALALLAAIRHWFALAAAALVTVVCIATQSTLYVAEAAPPDAAPLVTMTANLRLGEADPAAVVRAVRDHGVGVLALEELTADEQAALVRAGLDRVLPYHLSRPSYGATGTGLWSRWPLRSAVARTDFTFAFITARISVPGAGAPVTAVALHMSGPVPDATYWHRDIDHLPAVLRELGRDGAVVVGGDFNATPDVAQFRDLLVDGYADAAEQAGAGLTATYPANTWYPPLIAIDHVLTRGAVATSVDTVHIAGSDHRALVVHVALRR